MKHKMTDIDNNVNFKDESVHDLIMESKDAIDCNRFIDQQFPFQNVVDFHEWLCSVYGLEKLGFYKKENRDEQSQKYLSTRDEEVVS